MGGRTYAAALVMLALAAGLWIRFCSGPEVAVTQAELLPPAAPGAPSIVRVELTNRGFGEGDVTVRIHLRDPAGQLYQQSAKLELEPHGRVRAQVPVQAPPGSTLAEVKAEYPPE